MVDAGTNGPHRDAEQSILSKPLVPSLYSGAAIGACGFAYGTIAGVLIQTSSPTLFTALAATQWFATGTTYFYTRNLLLLGPLSKEKKAEKIAASGIAGSCSGAVWSRFIGRGVMVKGSIMFGVLAAAGQTVMNAMQNSRSTSDKPSTLGQKLSSWLPVKTLSDKEYEDLLLDKLLKLDTEIALLDDQIAELQAARKTYLHNQTEQTNTRPS